jgi:hypothetical protein
MTVTEIFFALLPSLLVSLYMAFFNRRIAKRDKYSESLDEARRQSDQLKLSLLMATAQLSYAVAVAIKRGHPNGEIEEAAEQYNEALAAFREFERVQVTRLDTKR